VLVRHGIVSHIADQELWNRGELSGTEAIRVMVDNRAEDRARRALDVWRKRHVAERDGGLSVLTRR
jgi:hypothetical protein